MIYITGDTHSDFGDLKFRIKHHKLTEEDTLIICGDFGFVWATTPDGIKYEKSTIKHLDELPPTILFIDGNHENFDRLEKYPEIDMYGGKVGQIGEYVFHLKRGYVFTIEDITFFTMGGGVSIDKAYRKEFISWWSQEQPSAEEHIRGLASLEKVNYQVDCILTHSAPDQARDYVESALAKTGSYGFQKLESQKNEGTYHTMIHDKVEFKQWYFGHYHSDFVHGKFHCHYDGVELLELD